MNLFHEERPLSFFHLLNTEDATREDLKIIFALADIYRDGGKRSAPGVPCKGKILANMFCEASTRTRFSFAAAMYRLGGDVISLESGAHSSQEKGESVEDTGRVMAGYADIIVFRHPEEGSAARFSAKSPVPVINGGDGANQHPTQSLIDLYHLYVHKGRLENLHIVFTGDLRYSRTVYPLMRRLTALGNRVTLIAPPGLEPDDGKLDALGTRAERARIGELPDILHDADALYVTRLQKERLPDPHAFADVIAEYRVTRKTLRSASADLHVMHPLPRTEEIDPEIDDLPQAGYFIQAENGLFVRMALLQLMAGDV